MSSLPDAPATLRLSPVEWEKILVEHYLRSDGPSGSTPLTFVDATPAEIATATGFENLNEDLAQRAFLTHFSRGAVRSWLSGSLIPSMRDAPLPGYFRYLVLTALVSATDTGVGASHNFRIRLGQLLNAEGQFNSVSGVNALWEELVGWCDRKRAAGEPYRKVLLPNYGNANLIGYAVRIAFPSWRDRSALTQIMRRLSPATRRSPERLVQELTRGRYAHELPDAVSLALSDFQTALRARRRMLLGHRFWRLAQSIDARLAGERGEGRECWRLEVRFNGYEQDIARLALYCDDGRVDGPVWEGALHELETLSTEVLPKPLFAALQHGVLVFTEMPGIVWRLDEESPPEGASVVVVARDGSIADRWPLNTEWRELEGHWRRSARMDAMALTGLCSRLGMEPAGRVHLVDLTFDGGVKTGRSTWLGRPGFLPRVMASSMSTLIIEPSQGAAGNLEIEGQRPCWDLFTKMPVSGRWRVKAQELDSETEKVICFEPVAPERWEFPELPSRLELERDLIVEDSSAETALVPKTRDDAFRPPLDDILEAIYAGPSGGWSEADLISVLQPAMPHDYFVWDFLRGLAEAGWLEAVVLRSWRARFWRLRPPCLRDLGSAGVVAAGALGVLARRRLEDTAVSLGGEVEYLPGVSSWCVSLPLVRNVDAQELAKETNWPLRSALRPLLPPAPQCWPVEPRSGAGRLVAGLWSFETGIFVPPERHRSVQPVSLERLVRERGDDRDVYRVTGEGDDFVASTRTVAILEAHRRLRVPLFEWSDGKFRRAARSGYLPLEIARALVIRASSTSGPLPLADGTWSYAYPADDETSAWVGRTLGYAVRVDRGASRHDLLDRIIEARRSGRRFKWYESMHS
ncbi:hypothetical protein [Sinorhizobium sp. 22678]|uniref:hypothetical protein n=1 Tax=Sinorhizobium sp. 22678 TaxID=3453955 RepID=UPI003F867C4C